MRAVLGLKLHTILASGLILGAAAMTSVAAQEAAPKPVAEAAPCDKFEWPLAIEKAWFADPAIPQAKSGDTLADLPQSGIALALRPAAEVTLIGAPSKTITENARSGSLTVQIPVAGTYQLTSSIDGWLNLVQGGTALKSTAHTGSRGCETVRKSVRFVMNPGPAILEVSGVSADTIRLAIRKAD